VCPIVVNFFATFFFLLFAIFEAIMMEHETRKKKVLEFFATYKILQKNILGKREKTKNPISLSLNQN